MNLFHEWAPACARHVLDCSYHPLHDILKYLSSLSPSLSLTHTGRHRHQICIMDIKMKLMSCSFQRRRSRNSLSWSHNPATSFRVNINYCIYTTHEASNQRKISSVRPDHQFLRTRASKNSQESQFFRTRASKNSRQSIDVPSDQSKSKRGSIVGAVALIIGTSIGTGILELPKTTSPAGIIPSSVSMILCWLFLLIEALILAEINVGLLKNKQIERETEELQVISIRTMAQETLGDLGGTLTTVIYIFLGTTTMVAYISKSGVLIHNLINIPTSVAGFFFTGLFTVLVSVGGTRVTDQVNQLLTSTMIGILVVIEVSAVLYGGCSGLDGSGNWGKVSATLPVIIFSLVYHDLLPVICAYLGGDLVRIRVSLIIGSLVPLLALLVWDAVALGLLSDSGQVLDPLNLLMSMRWSGISEMVEAFSLLAVATSLIGTLLGFSQFFIEQLSNLSNNTFSLTEKLNFDKTIKNNELSSLKQWRGGNYLSFIGTTMAVAPALFISSTVPDAFSAATDFAGGYCMTMLFGVLPPAMAWAVMHNSSSDNDYSDGDEEDDGPKGLSKVKPAVICAGLFSCGVVIDQLFEDLPMFHP